jgi:hypothetical protein
MAMGNMIGALFEQTNSAKQTKMRQPKPKKNGTTKGEKSVSSPAQQHGELAGNAEPKPITDRAMVKDHAKRAMRHATEDWVEGRMTTKEHTARHERAKHVISGKAVREFKGTTGERAPGKMGKGKLW